MLTLLPFSLAILFSADAVSAKPSTIPIVSRPIAHSKRVAQRALLSGTVPLVDQYQGTDLQWYGNISVGTPPQIIPVVFDTGSPTLEFTSTQCTTCPGQILFDVNKSSTYVDGGVEQTLAFSTGGGVTPTIGDNTEMTMLNGSDTVTIGGLTVTDTALYTIVSQTPIFESDPYSGLQGMSTQAQGFFAALIAQGLPSVFSLYLTPERVGNAELTIGWIDETKIKGNLIYAPVPSNEYAQWELVSPEIYVNGKTTSLLTQERTITFDSGTSNVLFPTDTTEAIYALISPEIKPYPNETGTYGIACHKVASLPAVVDITFISTSNKKFNLTIPSSELSVGPFADDPKTCQMFINAFDGLDLVGGTLLKHYYSVWDVGNQQIGFVPNGF